MDSMRLAYCVMWLQIGTDADADDGEEDAVGAITAAAAPADAGVAAGSDDDDDEEDEDFDPEAGELVDAWGQMIQRMHEFMLLGGQQLGESVCDCNQVQFNHHM